MILSPYGEQEGARHGVPLHHYPMGENLMKIHGWLSCTFIFAATALVGMLLLASVNFTAAGADGRPAANDKTIPEASPNLAPDERFKTDILVIVAHPDDETEVTGYLARAIFDEHKRVAVIFGTPGNGGGAGGHPLDGGARGDGRFRSATRVVPVRDRHSGTECVAVA